MESETSNQPTWQAESTHPDLAQHLRKSLREVKDPELGLDVIQLGLIRDVTLSEDQVDIKMILTTPFCPYGPAMIEEVTDCAETALDLPVFVELVMEVWDGSMMEDGLAADWGLF
jgi:metal-sulfur cluster biosynthetic enzyme